MTIYPGAPLMPPQQTYDGITKEIADIGYGIFAYHRGRFPLTEVLDLPLGYKNPAVPTQLINAYYKKFKPKELDDVKVLFLEAHGPGILSTKTPVTRLEDIKGMKIRAHGESARIASALSVLVFTLCKKDLDFKSFVESIRESLRLSTLVLMLIASSTILGHFVTVTNIPAITAEWVVQLPIHRSIIMVLITLIYLIGGSFIDDLAFMILATPIFFPVILKLGYDPLWAGIMICLTVMIGGVIPPVAMNVFIVKKITNVPISDIYSGVYPFLIAMIGLGVLLFVFPQITLFLPNALMK